MSLLFRPKRVKEDADNYSFTFNGQRPLIGSPEAKRMTSLLDAKGLSVVATKEILCCREKPEILLFTVIPTFHDEKKNESNVRSVQDLITCLTAKRLKVCLYFLQLKVEHGEKLVDTPVAQFNGETPSQYKQSRGYEPSTPISAAYVFEQCKEVGARVEIDAKNTILMGTGPAGCLVVNMAFAHLTDTSFAAYGSIDSYLPRNFSMYSKFANKSLNRPMFMSNSASPENSPSSWGNETFHDLRSIGLRPSSSCYFSIRSKAESYWDYVSDWIESYVHPLIEGRETLYRQGRRVSWAPEDILEDYIEYDIDSGDENGYEWESDTLHSLVLGF